MAIGSKISGALAKTAGVAGLVAVGYDAHHRAKTSSVMYEQNHKSNTIAKDYMNLMKLDSSSEVKNAVNKRIFNFKMDNNIDSFFGSIKGYCKGFGSMLVDHVLPLGLSLGAVLTKGALSKTFGLGLAVYGTCYLAKEILGIGKE